MATTLQQLRQKLSSLQKFRTLPGPTRVSDSKPTISIGVQRIFSEPLAAGTLIEWLAEEGAGRANVAFQYISIATRQFVPFLVVIDPDGTFAPVSLIGFSLDRMLVIRPRRDDVAWTFEQVLRSPARPWVLGPLAHILPSAYRRLKLAAEHGGSVGMFFRHPKYRREPSWADYRILISPRPGPDDCQLSRHLAAELIYARGQNISQQQVHMRIDNEAGFMFMDSELDGAAALEQTA